MNLPLNENRITGPLSIFIFIFLFFACETDSLQPDKSGWGYEYYPLETNSYRIYSVRQIDYSLSRETDTSDYQLKEVAADSFLSLSNEYSFFLKRFIKDPIGEEWILDSVWTVEKNAERVVATENNMPYIKMVFPAREGKQWDGNRMNVLGEQEYTMNRVGAETVLTSGRFDQTINVLQWDNPDTILVREKAFEIYAKNIGLIYKETVQLKYCAEMECIGEGIIESGKKYKQELVDYGKE